MSVSWVYEKDLVTILHDPKAVTSEKLAKVIADLGYRVERSKAPEREQAKTPSRRKAPQPTDAPEFFREALARAKDHKKPVVIDFSATWCAPCQRLKRETLADPKVADALGEVELILVDLDKYPRLAKAYGVSSIPDVFFIDRDGWIVDRLKKFEAAGPFLTRVRNLLNPVQKDQKSAERRGAEH